LRIEGHKRQQDLVGITIGGWSDPDPSETLPVEELITTHTGRGFWDDNEDASCVLNNGILVVKATKKVHREVRRLLNVLRRNK
ncbi:MAG: hypothetical protein IIA12_04865, partial [Proteobacteria bacterium]|nr:hypothetical protein [Pseudomonadota bacterium]